MDQSLVKSSETVKISTHDLDKENHFIGNHNLSGVRH